MDDALLVRLRERPAHLLEDARRVREGQALQPLEPLVERLADEHLHDDVRLAVLGDAVVEDLDGVLRLDRRGRPRLAVEAGARVGVVGVVVLDELDGDRGAEGRVPRLPHRAHAALADATHQLVLSSDERGGGRRQGLVHGRLLR